jgi:hypothetical protein
MWVFGVISAPSGRSLLGDPRLEHRPRVAHVLADLDVRQPPGARRLAHPRWLDVQQRRRLLGVQQRLLQRHDRLGGVHPQSPDGRRQWASSAVSRSSELDVCCMSASRLSLALRRDQPGSVVLTEDSV